LNIEPFFWSREKGFSFLSLWLAIPENTKNLQEETLHAGFFILRQIEYPLGFWMPSLFLSVLYLSLGEGSFLYEKDYAKNRFESVSIDSSGYPSILLIGPPLIVAKPFSLK
jgi:hypothetical protein